MTNFFSDCLPKVASPYGWQTACNMIGVLSGIIAATLYGNIGIKVIYNNVLMELFRAPPLTTKSGKILWAIIVPISLDLRLYPRWIHPRFLRIDIGHCRHLFRPVHLHVPRCSWSRLLHPEECSPLPDEGFNPETGEIILHDRGFARWKRGFFGKRWWLNILLVLYTGGSLSISGLGAYAACKGLMAAFANPQINAFTCQSPLNLNA